MHYHNQRCNRTRKEFLGKENRLDLRAYIDIPKIYRKGVMKCRIIYSDLPEEVTFSPYLIKDIASLRLVYDDEIAYSAKHIDRTTLQSCYDKRCGKDDIIIIKNGYLTDTYYGNIALFQDAQWFTPEVPLLSGTRRAQLIAQKRIIPFPITADQLSAYSHVCIFNAMIPFGKMVLPTSEIYR